MTPAIPARRIAAAAKALDDPRRARLNPPDLVDIVPEAAPTAAPGEALRRDLRGVGQKPWTIDGAAVRVSLVCFGENRSLIEPSS